jgi:hypothetical protein
MEEKKDTGFEKWVIVPVVVNAGAIAKIDYRIPGNVRHCTGIAFTVSEANGANPGDFMGEISLSFNNRKSHPLNFLTEYKTSSFRMDQMLLKLEEPLIGGSHVTGYYRNLQQIPHKLSIYLQCIMDVF